jgi:CheY-like chemotaxis protein
MNNMGPCQRNRTTSRSPADACWSSTMKSIRHRPSACCCFALDLDGSEVAAQLRLIPGCEAALIIAITGHGDEHRPRMLKAGCDAFYVKPIEAGLIEDCLRRR